jgi:hypothetical protein
MAAVLTVDARLRVMAADVLLRATVVGIRRRLAAMAVEDPRTAAARRMAADPRTAAAVVAADMGGRMALDFFPAQQHGNTLSQQ